MWCKINDTLGFRKRYAKVQDGGTVLVVYDGADTRKQDAKAVTRGQLLGVLNSILDRVS